MDKESTKWIRFLGGKNLLYTLTILCLIAVTIFLFNTVSFIFKPIFVIFSAVLGPVLFGIILFYLLNPMVKRLEKNSPCLGDCDSLCLNYCITSVSWTATFPNYPRPNGRINQTIPKFLEKHAPNSTRIYG